MGEIENEFQNICFNYNLIKNQIFKEKLIQTNNLKIKKSHSKEKDNQSSPICNKEHTYDFELVDRQNNNIEVKTDNNHPSINFTNTKDREQRQVSGNMIDKNVFFSIKPFFVSLNF